MRTSSLPSACEAVAQRCRAQLFGRALLRFDLFAFARLGQLPRFAPAQAVVGPTGKIFGDSLAAADNPSAANRAWINEVAPVRAKVILVAQGGHSTLAALRAAMLAAGGSVRHTYRATRVEQE